MSTGASTIVVRASRPDDAPALHAIALSIITAYGLPPEPELLTYGRRGRATFTELVATIDDVPVGTVSLSLHPRAPEAGWVSKFFVDPITRGMGVGRALHRALLVEAHRAGLDWLELSTLRVFREAITLYESYGWKRRSGFRGHERRYVLVFTARD